MGKRLLVEAEIAAVLDRVLEVPSVTPKRDGEGETALVFSSFWDFTVKFAPLVELLNEWSSPITDDGSTCGIVSGFLNLESVFAIADAALLFPENENGTEFIPFVSEIEPPNNGKLAEVAAAVVDVEKPSTCLFSTGLHE